MELDLIKLDFDLKFRTTKFNTQINLTLTFLIQKYFCNDNPTWNLNHSD